MFPFGARLYRVSSVRRFGGRRVRWKRGRSKCRASRRTPDSGLSVYFERCARNGVVRGRGELDLETDIESDTASLHSLVADMLDEAAKPGSLDACEILGLDPLYVANEGKRIALVSAEHADAILARMKDNPRGVGACIIGEVKAEPKGIVSMTTGFGGTPIVDMLAGEQLPRIC